MNKRLTIIAAGTALGLIALAGCSDADVASHNMSKEADNFGVYRQIVVYNGITDKYILEVRGFCSIGNDDKAGEVTYTCKTGEDQYVKDIIKKSDNVLVFAHQLKSKGVSSGRYEVNFKPSAIAPDIRGR